MSYHIGIKKDFINNAYVIQMKHCIDCLSCELIEYLGERDTTKQEVKAKLRETKQDVLHCLNKRYNTQVKRIYVE